MYNNNYSIVFNFVTRNEVAFTVITYLCLNKILQCLIPYLCVFHHCDNYSCYLILHIIYAKIEKNYFGFIEYCNVFLIASHFQWNAPKPM